MGLTPFVTAASNQHFFFVLLACLLLSVSHRSLISLRSSAHPSCHIFVITRRRDNVKCRLIFNSQLSSLFPVFPLTKLSVLPGGLVYLQLGALPEQKQKIVQLKRLLESHRGANFQTSKSSSINALH